MRAARGAGRLQQHPGARREKAQPGRDPWPPSPRRAPSVLTGAAGLLPMPSGPGPAAAPALPRGICRTFCGLGNSGKGWRHPARRGSGGLAACPRRPCCLLLPSQVKPDECPSVSGLSSLRHLSWRQQDPKGRGGWVVESWVGDRSLGEESGARDRPGRK